MLISRNKQTTITEELWSAHIVSPSKVHLVWCIDGAKAVAGFLRLPRFNGPGPVQQLGLTQQGVREGCASRAPESANVPKRRQLGIFVVEYNQKRRLRSAASGPAAIDMLSGGRKEKMVKQGITGGNLKSCLIPYCEFSSSQCRSSLVTWLARHLSLSATKTPALKLHALHRSG